MGGDRLGGKNVIEVHVCCRASWCNGMFFAG